MQFFDKDNLMIGVGDNKDHCDWTMLSHYKIVKRTVNVIQNLSQ